MTRMRCTRHRLQGKLPQVQRTGENAPTGTAHALASVYRYRLSAGQRPGHGCWLFGFVGASLLAMVGGLQEIACRQAPTKNCKLTPSAA